MKEGGKDGKFTASEKGWVGFFKSYKSKKKMIS